MRKTTKRIEYNSSINPSKIWNKNAFRLSKLIKIKLKLKEDREGNLKKVFKITDSRTGIRSKKRFSLKFLKKQFMKRLETR